MRNHKAYQKVQTGPRMTTEYQDRFRLPSRPYAATTKSKQKGLRPPQTDTTANIATVRSAYVSTQWMQKPQKAPQSDTKGTQTKLSEIYTTTYKADFKAQKPNIRVTFGPKHSLNVHQGLCNAEGRNNSTVVEAKSIKRKEDKKPFEGVTTTYRNDYIPQPVQPRPSKVRNAHPTSKDLLKMSDTPKGTYAAKREHLNEANELIRQFQMWSFETKLHGDPKDSKFQYAAHESHVGPKNRSTSVVSMQRNKSEELLQMVTKKSYESWNRPQSFTSTREASDWNMKTTFSRHDPKPVETRQTFSRPHPKVSDSAPSKSTSQRHQHPAEGGGLPAFDCSAGMFWSSPLSQGMSWFLGKV